MTALKIPSLQHLARNWYERPEQIKSALVRVARNPPKFTYQPVYSAIRDRHVLHVSIDQILEGFARGVHMPLVRQNFVELFHLVEKYFADVPAEHMWPIERRFYRVSRDVSVPFEPPLVYSAGGRLVLPWMVFWRRNPLSGKRLALFASIAKEILKQDPDLDGAQFSILDFSVPPKAVRRELFVIEASEIPVLPKDEINKMMEIFIEGYQMAKAELASGAGAGRSNDASESVDDKQADLFTGTS